MTSNFPEEVEYAASLDQESAARILHYVCNRAADTSEELPDTLNAVHEMLVAFMRSEASGCENIPDRQFCHITNVVISATKLMVDLSAISHLTAEAKKR